LQHEKAAITALYQGMASAMPNDTYYELSSRTASAVSDLHFSSKQQVFRVAQNDRS
jgi:hypothetical protein